MKNCRDTLGLAGIRARLLAAFIMLMVATGASADGGDGVCAPLYVRSGAIQGSSTCFANAWGNTPINLSNHYCVNEPSRITRWCGTPPDDMWVNKQGIPRATEAKQCKPAGATEAGAIVFKRQHYIKRAVRDGLNLDHAEAQVADEISAMRSEPLIQTHSSRLPSMVYL